MSLWNSENEFLSVTIHADASADIIDRTTGERWHMGRVAMQDEGIVDVGHCWLRTERSVCEQFPARFVGETQSETIRFTMHGREGRAIGQFSIEPRLNGRWFDVRIFDIDESIPSLVFPTPIVSESLVFPHNGGRWFKTPFPTHQWWVYPVHLRMRWFGGLKGDNGWIAILHEGYADGGALTSELLTSPAWLKSMGTWRGDRTVRYGCTSGGYVGMAKTFREYAIEQGMFRSLREKLDARPVARNLLGSDLLSFFMAEAKHPERYEDIYAPPPANVPPEGHTPEVYVPYREVNRLIERSRAAGVKKSMVVLRGWINGGYDESHPDIFPYESSLGTDNELKTLLGSETNLTALHDNYQDIYLQSPSFPRGVLINRRGELMRGGIWAGGQSYLIDAKSGVENARRNWNVLRELDPRAMFIDTTIAVQLYENYAPGLAQTRAEDLAFKRDLLQFYRDQGQVVGSEEGSDWGVPLVEWVENRHHRIPGVSIPLWPLVFHDAAFCTRYLRPVDHGLTDMLWGYLLLWDFRDPLGWEANLRGIESLRHVAAWHDRIGLEEMRSHRYLSEDGQIEETTFESAAIVCNFADEPCTVDGVTVAAGGYVIRE